VSFLMAFPSEVGGQGFVNNSEGAPTHIKS